MIRAGELRHSIVIQSKTITQDEELNPIETWADFLTLRAAALPKDGREFYRMSTVNSEITEVFKARYNSSVTAHMRVKFRNKYFEIIGPPINPEERDVEMLLTCKAVV